MIAGRASLKSFWVFLILSVWVTAGVGAERKSDPSSSAIFPDRHWEHVNLSEQPDHVAQAAARLRMTLSAGQTTGMMVVVNGRVVFEYGNTAEVSYIASARKSVISMLYGKYVTNRTIPLDTTLRALGIDDEPALLPQELDATVGDLLSARSGVYHPAANLGDASERAPSRGSVKHGGYFLYNNWDFNALGAILEKVTGRSPYDLFSTDIAGPIGLEDWNAEPGAYASFIRNDTGLSRFPAHHFMLSTRDMARLGYLMLRNGRWKDRQVIDRDWVKRSTSLITSAAEVTRTSPFIAGLGYGYLWWIFDPLYFKGSPLAGAYTASGALGQYITVIPQLDMVVAHKTAVPPPRNVHNETYFNTILTRVLELSDRSGSPEAARSQLSVQP
jgi:CubicO group peptidase (beta-lactamase class C family)